VSERRTSGVLAAVVATALALRLLHLHAVAPSLLDRPPDVGMDRWLAMHVAEAVARGDLLGGWSADYDSGPGYAYLLGAVRWASGGRWLPAIALQAVLGALACLLVHGAARRLWSPTAGLLAATLLALYAPALFYETLLVKFSLVTITVAALLYCLTRAAAATGRRWPLLGGLALGVLQALRGNAIVLAIPCVWWLAREGWTRTTAVRVAWLCAGAALVAAPLAVRDRAAALQSRGTSLWGIHFYVGTQPGADGAYRPVPGVRDDVVGHVVDARTLAEETEGRPLGPFGVSWHWVRRGLAAVRADPAGYAALEARKLYLALAGDEEGSFGDDYADSVEASWVLRRLPLVSFGSVVPLGLLGLLLALHQQRALLPAWFAIAYALSLLPFFVTARYRLPLVVPLLLLAGGALDWLAAQLRGRPRATLPLAGLFLAGALWSFAAGARERWTFAGVLVLGVGVALRTSSLDVAEGAQPLDAVVGGEAWAGRRRHGELAETRTGVPEQQR
jgi:4-amino-4-deoxy-L-arabinose transferase-like glycosyltransferase